MIDKNRPRRFRGQVFPRYDRYPVRIAGLDAVDLRGLDQGRDAPPRPAALVMASEQGVLSVQSDRADQVLDAVGVDFDTPVLEEGLKPVPMAVDVGELFPKAGLGRDTQSLFL